MNFFVRSRISIVRQPIKSILLFLLLLVVGVFLSAALITNQAITTTEQSIRNYMRPVVTIEFDENLFTENQSDTKSYLTSEIISSIGESSSVTYFNYMVQSHLSNRHMINFCPWDQPWGLFVIRGFANENIFQFEDGILELIDGRLFVEEDFLQIAEIPVLLNEKIAELNSLEVGSQFQLNKHYTEYNYITTNFIVIGIYRDPNEDFVLDPNIRDIQVTIDNLIRERNINTIYMPITAILNIYQQHNERISQFAHNPENIFPSLSPIFVVADPMLLPQFVNENSDLLPEYFYFVDEFNTFEIIGPSIQSINNISNGILIGSIVATILIVLLLIGLFLKDRRHEIGIYIALGDKKSNILKQVLFEVLTISFLAIICSFFIGNVLANHVSNELLHQELINQSTRSLIDGVTLNSGGGFTFNPNDTSILSRYRITATELDIYEVIEMFDLSFSVQYLLLTLITGLVVVLISVSFPIMKSLKSNPKKTLL